MQSSQSIRLRIITPEHIIYDETVNRVILPSSKGEIGILHHHIPFMSYLRPGRISIHLKDNRIMYLPIENGLFECKDDLVTILTKDELNIEDAFIEEDNKEATISGQ